MDDFLRFVAERHRIWEKRQAALPPPWTNDPVLSAYKMTNVFRVLDPGTQFVLTDLAEPELSERDRLMRLFLYRHTGRVETWRLAKDIMGSYPVLGNLDTVQMVWKLYRDHKGGRVFTSAYVVCAQSSASGTDKLDSIFDLTRRLFTPGSPDDVMPDWNKAQNQRERFYVLQRNKGVGDFMAMQVLADWTYLQDQDLENTFLQPGPGSLKGAKALFPDQPASHAVVQAVVQVQAMPDCPRLGDRKPSLMDIGSNLLCEWSKYDRWRSKPGPMRPYLPEHPGPQPAPVLPRYYTNG